MPNGWSKLAKVVIRLDLDADNSVEGLANARLIASAPDLLKSLQRFVAFADKLNEDNEFESSMVREAKVIIKKIQED
jgi:hypothetical protein